MAVVTGSWKERALCSAFPFITFLGSCLHFTLNLLHFYRFQRFCVDKGGKKKNKQAANNPNISGDGYVTDTIVGDNVGCFFSNLVFVLAALESLVSSLEKEEKCISEEMKLAFVLPSPVFLVGFRWWDPASFPPQGRKGGHGCWWAAAALPGAPGSHQ